MSPADAAKLLDLPGDASPEQIETRFNELRAKLEDKIAKAPTPGLKAKYRESLDELTAACEALTLAADASTLPMVGKSKSVAGGADPGPKAKPPAPGSPPPVIPAGSEKQKSGGREFLVVAVIAVAVLGAGGWWVMKTREENAEKARAAAEQARLTAQQKADAEHQAELARQKSEQERMAKEAADKAERERQEKALVTLRTQLAGLNVTFDAVMRSEQSAERELTELKSQERDLGRAAGGTGSLEALRLSAQARAQDSYVRWLRDFLSAHPVRVARAKAEELLAAKALLEAEPALAGYAAELATLRSEQAARRPDLAAIAAAQQLPPPLPSPPAPAPAPVTPSARPDGPQYTLGYLADRLYPYDEPALTDVRNHILYDDLRVVLFPALEPHRNKLRQLWSDVEKQLQGHAGQETQLRALVGRQFSNSAALLRAIDANQALDATYLKDPTIQALIMVRWQILNIREQAHQAHYYFGLNPS